MTDRKLDLPDTADIQQPDSAGRLNAPSAERNAEAILALLRDHAPATGHAFEIASGTGQHIARFAAEFPGLTWQPSDLDPDRLDSIAAWTAGASNVLPPLRFDAARHDWPAPAPDLILLVNLLHLISGPAARAILTCGADALAPGGIFIVYGPFRRDGRLTSPGDTAFDASLKQQNAAIGYKDADEVSDWALAAGLNLAESREMPANNLALVLEKP